MGALLEVNRLEKIYRKGHFDRTPTFHLTADFSVGEPTVVGMMGPNGSGKTTLFELITGSNRPCSGEVLVAGNNIHAVRTDERDRLAIHYHQSYQVRHFRSLWPNFMLRRAESEYPLIHLFDEPQFNTQDGYIGFMLEFFRKLRAQGRIVFLCLHPNERFHLEIMEEICERYIFVQRGAVATFTDFESLTAHEPVRAYLGNLLTRRQK